MTTTTERIQGAGKQLEDAELVLDGQEPIHSAHYTVGVRLDCVELILAGLVHRTWSRDLLRHKDELREISNRLDRCSEKNNPDSDRARQTERDRAALARLRQLLETGKGMAE